MSSFEDNRRVAWHRKSRSNSEGRIKMILFKWEAGREQTAMCLCTSLGTNTMPNCLMGIRSQLEGVIEGELAVEMVWERISLPEMVSLGGWVVFKVGSLGPRGGDYSCWR